MSEIEDQEKIWLTHAFPSSLRHDVEEVIKILPFNRNVLLAGGKVHKVDSLMHLSGHTIYVNNELLKIPYRVYFDEPQKKETKLAPIQKTILNCIYSRHHNGFVRQRHLEQLLDSNDYFVVPYTFQLLGEYVMEILTVLDKHMNDKTIDNYIQFISENPKYWHQTQSRMISYWNEYYRQEFPQLKDYIGKQIVDRIKRRRNVDYQK